MDCGDSDKDSIIFDEVKGDLDIYLFTADSLMGLVSTLTVVTGRPIMLLKFTYSFTLVENEVINTRGLLWDIKTLRERNIPCDAISKDPHWMETHYDVSIDKKWNSKDFYIPYWLPENTSRDFTFFYPCGDVNDVQVKIFGAKPASITRNHEEVDFVYEDNAAVFTLPAAMHRDEHVTYTIIK